MRTKSCKKCGRAFDTGKQGAYLCPECADASRKSSVCLPRVCSYCGATFLGFPRSFRCPACQHAAQLARQREYRRHGPSRPLGSVDKCEVCGAEYIVSSGLQRYCKACADQAITETIRARKRAYNADNADWLVPLKEANRSNNKVCVVCGAVFDSSTCTVTCSPECRAVRKRETARAADLRRRQARKNQSKEDTNND